MNMIIRKFKEDDAEEVSELIRSTFMKCTSKDFTKKGIESFLKHETPEKLKKRAEKRIILVAAVGKKIAGVIEAKNENRISRFFVDASFQKRGVGTKLYQKIERICRQRKSKVIKIYSSLDAVKFYEKMGYNKTGKAMKNRHGIVYQRIIKKF